MRRGTQNNNTNEIEKAFLTIDKQYHQEDDPVKQLMAIIEILWKSASSNTAFKMNRSERHQEDVSIEILLEAIERVSKDPIIKKMMKDILAEGKLLPKYPVKMENYHFDEFELTSTEGNTIYYNVFTVCPHDPFVAHVKPCDDCTFKSMKQREHMLEMVKRMYCE